MSFIAQSEYGRLMNLPIALPQTELRRQGFIQICTFKLELGQHLELCCLHLNVFRVLTPGVNPILADSSLGLASVGMLASTMFTSALGLVTCTEIGVASWNADQPVIVTAPGTYSVTVYNNSLNVDLSVVVTGSVRLLY